ncbi:MAG: hypothetical protein DMF56_14600 [Acidobacteria bacterium]|nr:MAG: hypothetical protein DMF56_14600 [Acidobacteriota bacterium]
MNRLRLELTNGAYATSAAHLRDELARVDLLVRAQVVRWRRTIAAAKPPQLWGMMQVSDVEIDQYLATDPGPPGRVPEALASELRPHWDREIDAAADIRIAVAATPANVELRVERLRTRFALTDAELDVVLIALLPELDQRYRRIFGYLQDDASRASPPPDLITQMLHHKVPTLEEKTALFEPSGHLLRWRLIDLADRAVRIDPRVASYLMGHGGESRDAPEARTTPTSPIIMHGSEGSGRMDAARAISSERGLGLLRYDAEEALRDPMRAFREARLQNAALYFADTEKVDELIRATEGMDTLTFIAKEGATDSAAEARCPRYDIGTPHYEERRSIWLEQTGDEDAAARLAAAFQFTPGRIREAVEMARVSGEDLYTASRRLSGRRLAAFARRIEPTPELTVESVVLPRPNKLQLRELRDRVRLRARLGDQGLLVLFAGPSGTGKTFAATAIASEQGVDLYKVDASTVVSKWVGETEKNLSRVFADAEGSDALLFFDECDSLFGQRGEISDAQDRWANLQVNYLLQRVEDYPGVIILATNLRSNIDDAFLRRIRIIVEFPVPDPVLRHDLWRRSVADWKGLYDEELQRVAERFSLTGGSIRNVATETMFRALAKDRETLAVRDVIASVAREYQKLGRPVTKGEFGEEFYSWAVADVIAPAAD